MIWHSAQRGLAHKVRLLLGQGPFWLRKITDDDERSWPAIWEAKLRPDQMCIEVTLSGASSKELDDWKLAAMDVKEFADDFNLAKNGSDLFIGDR